MASISRRSLLAAGLALSAGSLPALTQASPTNVPPIWDGQKMYETLSKDGTYFTNPDSDGKPVALIAFDPQCPDCMKLNKTIKPLLKYMQFRFYPLAFLNIHSEPQGATMLASDKPFDVLEAQHKHFKDPDFRGIRYDMSKLSDEVRNKVWVNTKLHRRSGCRAVPYGVYKNSKGEFIPFDENPTTEELAKLLEIKDYKPE